MKYSYLFLLGGLALPGVSMAQQQPTSAVPFSMVQPRRYYVGISLGVPAYWREGVCEQWNQKSDNYKYEESVTLVVGRQLTPHWAVQVGLNGFVEPVSTRTYQFVSGPSVFSTGSVTYGAAVVALPVLLRYDPRLRMGLDVRAEGWIGLTPAWQRLQVDAEQYDNGQLTYDEHIHTQGLGMYATSGLSLSRGLGQGFEVVLDAGVACRVGLVGSAQAAPSWAPVGSLSFRYQLGGRAHRLRYQTAD